MLSGCEVDPNYTFAPDIITSDASNIKYNSITTGVTIAVKSLAKEVGIVYSLSENSPTISNSKHKGINVFVKGENLMILSNLDYGKMYYYRAYATDGNEVKYGKKRTFTTKTTSVILQTGDGVDLGYNQTLKYPFNFSVSATLTGFSEVKEWGMEISIYPIMTSPLNRAAFLLNQRTDGNLYTQYWGSDRSGDRYFRAYAILNDGDTLRGQIKLVKLNK